MLIADGAHGASPVEQDAGAAYRDALQVRTSHAHSVEKDTVLSRTRHDRLDCSPGCAVEAALQFIDGKWKGVILWHLLAGTLRFNQIRRLLPTVTQRMLTNQLRELEADGLVARRVYAEVPPKVEYSLTPRGRTLEPVLSALKAWGERHGGIATATPHDVGVAA